MRKILFGFAIASLACFACQTTSTHPADDDTGKAKIVHKDGLPENDVVPSIFVMNDSLIKMNLTNTQKGNITSVNGALNGKIIVCEVSVGRADSLFAELIPESADTDYYFDQIHYPEGQNEGPYGSNLQIGISQPGTYKLFIAQDKTSIKDAGQKFKIRVWLK